jgi:hypothetical protein
MILKIFSPKPLAKDWRFLLKTKLNYAKNEHRPLIGRLFTLGCFLKITELDQFFWLIFSRCSLCTILDKKWVGLHFG